MIGEKHGLLGTVPGCWVRGQREGRAAVPSGPSEALPVSVCAPLALLNTPRDPGGGHRARPRRLLAGAALDKSVCRSSLVYLQSTGNAVACLPASRGSRENSEGICVTRFQP